MQKKDDRIIACCNSLSLNIELQFKACKSVRHHTIQINQPNRCNNFSSLLFDVYLQLNMFRCSSGRSAVGRGRAHYRPNHDLQQCYHYAPNVKLEAATVVVDLMMMDVRTSETCSAINKREVINWINFCI
jgi:hypothetical protein